MTEEFVYPGQVLGHSDEFICGEGTYLRKQQIHSSVFGKKQIQEKMITVTRESEPIIVPEIHGLVTARVNELDHLLIPDHES